MLLLLWRAISTNQEISQHFSQIWANEYKLPSPVLADFEIKVPNLCMQGELDLSKMDLINSIVQLDPQWDFLPIHDQSVLFFQWLVLLWARLGFLGVISTFHHWLTGSNRNETIGGVIRNSNVRLVFTGFATEFDRKELDIYKKKN